VQYFAEVAAPNSGGSEGCSLLNFEESLFAARFGGKQEGAI